MAHKPERMCVGCRKMFEKSKLLRVIELDGKIIVDDKQKVLTRGVYFCRDKGCIAAARKKKALSKHFKRNVTDDIYEKLSEWI